MNTRPRCSWAARIFGTGVCGTSNQIAGTLWSSMLQACISRRQRSCQWHHIGDTFERSPTFWWRQRHFLHQCCCSPIPAKLDANASSRSGTETPLNLTWAASTKWLAEMERLQRNGTEEVHTNPARASLTEKATWSPQWNDPWQMISKKYHNPDVLFWTEWKAAKSWLLNVA